MYPIVKEFYTPPVSGTCSQKQAICKVLPESDDGALDITDNALHYYALPNSLDDDTIIQVLQCDTTK